ncbi:MAG: MOP flippase family protein [Calditrichaeota bacterium]|nr:MOP flippase family protein [Calditrichota bacterium]
MNLKEKTIQGIIWNGAGKFIIQGLQLVISVVLARLLTPADFGIIGIAMIFIGLIALVNEMGIAASIVQKLEVDARDLGTMFVTSLLVGMGLMVLLALFSKQISVFFRTPVLSPILKILSLTFLIGAVGIVQKALLNRHLNFRKIAMGEIAGILAYGLVSISLAMSGYGVWSIVWGTMTNSVVATLFFVIMSHWRPVLIFDYQRFKKMFHFGANVVGTNIVNYIRMNLATFITGRYLGNTDLGYYSLANTLSSMTVGRISFIIGRVMFPALSKIQDDNERFKNYYLKTIRSISIISFPLLVGLFVLAKPLVLTVYGEKWAQAIIPLQILAVVGLFRSIGTTVGFVLLAKGRSDIDFRWNIFYVMAFLLVLVVSVKHGLIAMVSGLAFVTIAGMPIIQKITNSLIDLTFKEMIRVLYPVFLMALAMGGIVYLAFIILTPFLPQLILLILCTFLGVLSYFMFMMTWNREEMKDLWKSLVKTNS